MRIGKIYHDLDDELTDGRGWNVVDADGIGLRYSSFDEAAGRVFDVHPGHIGFMVDLHGVMGGILVDAGDAVICMTSPLPEGIEPLRDADITL